MDTDASGNNIGAVLSQLHNKTEKVISYASRTLTKSESNYCVTKKEMLALVYFVKKFRHYLLGKKFEVRTDHKALSWLWNFKEPEDQIARWQAYLSEFEMEIVHRKGSNHNNADGMSRRPTAQLETEERDDGIASDSEFCQAVCAGEQIDWKKAQLKDVDLNLIQDFKSASNDKPIVEEGYSSTVKRLIGQWENIVPRDGILYRKFEDTNGTAYQFLVPTELRRNILETLHSGIGGGHLGTKKMLRKLKDRFYWPGWSQDVEIFCEECLTCATRRNPAKHLRAPLISV